MWPLKLIILEKWALFWGFQHTFIVFPRRWMGKCSFSRVNIGMWPLKSIVMEKQALVLRVSTHIYGVSKEIDRKMFIFQTKPRHVTPQIDCPGKMSTVLRVSTHIYCVSKEIDGKTFIFQSKPRHVTPQIDRPGKTSTVLKVWTHIYGVSQGDRWENVHF